MTRDTKSDRGLFITLVSVHGLIRGENLELGRDADTGGQTKYVVELARALAREPRVERVVVLTRRVEDPEISADYAEAEESLGDGASLIRLEAGPSGYIRKEELWDHLDSFVDNALDWLRQQPKRPDVIHGHYADAGYCALRIASLLGVPMVFTGHSLGRVKRRRLLASGIKDDHIESRYSMARRINAEEDSLAAAQLVIASTANEVEEQYALYDYYRPSSMRVIPPGTDLERFFPPTGNEQQHPLAADIRRFLREPDKPMILALSRPDERKNITTLVEAFGESAELQAAANLVIVAGNRDDIRELDALAQGVWTELLIVIDQYDLYGKVAYPKHHQADDVPAIYRLAAFQEGVFVNPALTEPFGLTLLEAAASGLPLVATEDGGPQDIIGNCRNGILVDPLDKQAMAEALLEVLSNTKLRREFVDSGLKGVELHYSWEAHANNYLDKIKPLVERRQPAPKAVLPRRRRLYHDRAVFTDLDQNLLGDPESLHSFVDFVRDNRKCAGFGIATGRRLESALKVMKRHGIPQPDVLITSVGTEIYYAPQLTADNAWARHIDYMWNSKAIRRVLNELPGLKIQAKTEQSRFKISYFIDPSKAPSLEEINSLLHQQDQAVNVLMSFGQFIDVLPIRASKGFALRYYADQWGIPLEHILVAGGSGNDEDMMRGNTLGVVVANRHNEELSGLVDLERVYFAERPYAAGILEAIEHYDFYRECRVPPDQATEEA
jgi:sucrose-phosphate synthase